MGRRDFYVLAGFLLFLLIYFSGVLVLPGEACLGRPEGDARNQFYGWRAYGFGEVRAGRFPLWNPYEFLGMPFVAGLQSAMFYPTNWLCAILPLGRAINLGILLNLFLSGLFTYLWARRYGLKPVGAIVAAGAYVFGAPQFLRIFEGHWSFLASMPWIPCLLLCVEILVSGRSPQASALGPGARSNADGCVLRGRLEERSSMGGFQPLAIAAGATAVAMQWFGGNPQYAFYGGIAVSLYLAGRLWQRREMGGRAAARILGSFGLIYVLGSVLAGVQLIPALELFSVSSRRGQLSYPWVAQDSFVPASLLTILAPDFFGSDGALPYWGQWNLWEMSAYVGVVAIGLAFVGAVRGERGKALLAGCIALVCLLLALGDHGPALKLLYGRVPGFDLFRGLARFLCPMSVFLGLLAGMGADEIVATAAGEARGSRPFEHPQGGPALLRPPNPARLFRAGEEREQGRMGRLRSAMWILAALAALLGLAGIALWSDIRPVGAAWESFMHSVLAKSLNHHPDLRNVAATPEFQRAAMSEAAFSLLRAGAFLAALVFLIQAALRASQSAAQTTAPVRRALDEPPGGRQFIRGPGKASWVAGTLLLLLAADAWSFGQRYLKTFDPPQAGLSKDAVDYLSQVPEPFRFARGGCFTFPPCEGMTHDFACIEGVQPNVPARFEDAFWSIQGLPKAAHRTSYSVLSGDLSPFRMFNLRYLIEYSNFPKSDIPGLRTVCDDQHIRIDELPSPWPRAWIVHRYAVVPDGDLLLKALTEFKYWQFALLEKAPGCPLETPPRDDSRAATFRRPYEPNHVEIHVNAASAGLLVLSDLHYPGWCANVDGKPAEILRANYVMRAVAVPQGEHKVEFSYEPASFKTGIAASAAGCLAVALLILLHLRRKKGGQ